MMLFAIIFITLCERKLLGYSQLRLGPNKIRLVGLAQPVLDGVKLLLKELTIINFGNKTFYFIGSLAILVVILCLWILIPSSWFMLEVKFLILLILGLIGLTVYSSLCSGWVSNSKYSLLGGIRAAAQTISYEVSLALVVVCRVFRIKAFSISYWPIKRLRICLIPLILLWCLTILSETNRAPFDFAEAESELVSGFNTEFLRGPFALLFIGEYGIILIFRLLTTILFNLANIRFLFIFCRILLIRSCFPRFRYDKLMSLMWFKSLPIRLNYLLLMLILF